MDLILRADRQLKFLVIVWCVLWRPSLQWWAISNTSFRDTTRGCDLIPGLSEHHKKLCYRYPSLMNYVQNGITQAQQECQYQFKRNRWNCTSVDNKPFLKLLTRGFRESAFSYAIVTAGITYELTIACGRGAFPECYCNPAPENGSNQTSFHFTNGSSWHMSGCHDSVDIASNIVLDTEPTRKKRNIDTKSLVTYHNNRVGIQALESTVTIGCKCHGISGTCATKTCLRKMAPFSVVGDYLRQKFHIARRVVHKRSGYGLMVATGRRQSRPPLENELIYYEKSPNFCSPELDIGWAGTSGRQCQLTEPRQKDSCHVLCCGRGYFTVYRETQVDCNCRHIFCCTVECDRCNSTYPTYFCK